MRPNVDEYDDIEDESAVGEEGGSHSVSWVVLAVAVGGFAALAYYAYHSGAKSMAESSNAPVIEADAGPIKEAPENPDGEQFANKDKTIYDVIDGQNKTSMPEKLMPEPERPVVAADVEDSEDSQPAMEPVAKPAPAPVAAAQPAMPVAEEHASAAPAEPVVANNTPPQAAEAPAAPTSEKMEVATAESEKPNTKSSYAAPQMINETTVTGKQEEPKAESAPAPKKQEAAKPAKAKPVSGGGAAKIQLGAYASEAEAQGAWKKLKAKFGSVLTGSPAVVKAEVNGKTYYRLRTSVADAKAACAKVQPCMAVK